MSRFRTRFIPQKAYAGWPALIVASSGLQVVVQKSILGGIVDQRTGNHGESFRQYCGRHQSRPAVAYRRGIGRPENHATTPGGRRFDASRACTVVGKVYATLLSLVSDSHLLGMAFNRRSRAHSAIVDRILSGLPANRTAVSASASCLRGSVTHPREFEVRHPGVGYCRNLSSTRCATGIPRYAEALAMHRTTEIRRGAHERRRKWEPSTSFWRPYAETDLRVRMREFLPVGFGIQEFSMKRKEEDLKMSFDSSRFTFDPWNNFSGVVTGAGTGGPIGLGLE